MEKKIVPLFSNSKPSAARILRDEIFAALKDEMPPLSPLHKIYDTLGNYPPVLYTYHKGEITYNISLKSNKYKIAGYVSEKKAPYLCMEFNLSPLDHLQECIINYDQYGEYARHIGEIYTYHKFSTPGTEQESVITGTTVGIYDISSKAQLKRLKRIFEGEEVIIYCCGTFSGKEIIPALTINSEDKENILKLIDITNSLQCLY